MKIGYFQTLLPLFISGCVTEAKMTWSSLNVVAPTVSIETVSPKYGSIYGGFNLTLTGTLFSPQTKVSVGGSNCENVSSSVSTSITCSAPLLSAGSYTATVTNPDGTTASLKNAITYG